MEDTSKYLIHARITADGVVERSDVVGAVFGQTEGLLGDELDLRGLQQSSKIGRIDVEIDSEHGQSFGTITITSSLDKVETAILAASLEAITRVGPCEARVEVADIEDMRAAKRREVVERAKELLAESFDDGIMDSAKILEEVREAQTVAAVDEYAGYPAGPRVADSDAVIVVEGRADVSTLLDYGIKNAIAVEGTNVPSEVAELTRDRTVTAFLDGDRGGDLILRELSQVGELDYVAFGPEGQSVEDLSREAVMDALREKVPFETIDGTAETAATDGSVHPAPGQSSDGPDPAAPSPPTEAAEVDTDDGETPEEAGSDSPTPAAPQRADGVDADGNRTTGSVRAREDTASGTVGGVGGEAGESVTVDPAAVVDEIAGATERDTTDEETPDRETSPGPGDTHEDDSERVAAETDASVSGTDAATESASVDGRGADTEGFTDTEPDEGGKTDAAVTPADAEVDTDPEPDADTEPDAAPDTELEPESDTGPETNSESEPDAESEADAEPDADTEPDAEPEAEADSDGDRATAADEPTGDESTDDEPATLRGHVGEVVTGGTNRARLLDESFGVVADVPAGEAFDLLADGETEGVALVIDGRLDQRLLDVAAQRGISQIVAASSGEFVKRPASVRVVTADRLASA
ncbi:DNA primase DnaG [Halobaculum sp. MBLA0147]|uniref:DNA primase DnaG n=1 Tax=Halobaculum sp. MBLA0147 TaxID=3079934 RepID=UPI0035247CE6